MSRRFLRQMAEGDVGKTFYSIFKGGLNIGRVLPSDVGKRVYLCSGVVQIENDRQQAERGEGE